MSVEPQPSNPGRSRLAILLVLTAMATFAFMDGLTKILSQTLPIPQILWFRSLVFTGVAIYLLHRQSKGQSLWSLARSQRPLRRRGARLMAVRR